MQAVDLTVKIFGRLEVKSRAPNRGQKRCWNCECACGQNIVATSSNLTSGHTSSCGCFKNENQSQIITTRNTAHGHNKRSTNARTPTYVTWEAMHQRCYNVNHVSYKNYGERGIKICERWFSFENFLNDMGERPFGRTIDRKDNNGDYEPSNCKWSTRSEQQKNKCR